MATQRAFHVLAQYRVAPGEIHQFDGVIRSTIDPFDDLFYHEIKRRIAEFMRPPRDPEAVSLMALSLLAERQID